MNIFTKPTNLNGQELIDELANVGIMVNEIIDFGNETIGFETDNQVNASSVVAAHNGTTIAPEPTVEDKLATVGLSLTDLKSALGLAQSPKIIPNN